MRIITLFLFLIGSSFLLTSCGGGGGGSSANNNSDFEDGWYESDLSNCRMNVTLRASRLGANYTIEIEPINDTLCNIAITPSISGLTTSGLDPFHMTNKIYQLRIRYSGGKAVEGMFIAYSNFDEEYVGFGINITEDTDDGGAGSITTWDLTFFANRIDKTRTTYDGGDGGFCRLTNL